MALKRRKLPFWRRKEPRSKYDISLLRPAKKPKGERFETTLDARSESDRSERLLRSASQGNTDLAEFLQECRDGDYECNRPFCPICARSFRRWLTGELLQVTKGIDHVHVYTVLLQKAAQDQIRDLCPTSFRHGLRKQLQRAGLARAPVIGGFEIVYKAKKKEWVLHINLVVVGADRNKRQQFEESIKKASEKRAIKKPIMGAPLSDPPDQLSYILKFSTYHRPHEQDGSNKSEAKPLNGREHAALVKWMSQFEFEDFLLLINAKRKDGTKIVLREH